LLVFQSLKILHQSVVVLHGKDFCDIAQAYNCKYFDIIFEVMINGRISQGLTAE